MPLSSRVIPCFPRCLSLCVVFLFQNFKKGCLAGNRSHTVVSRFEENCISYCVASLTGYTVGGYVDPNLDQRLNIILYIKQTNK